MSVERGGEKAYSGGMCVWRNRKRNVVNLGREDVNRIFGRRILEGFGDYWRTCHVFCIYIRKDHKAQGIMPMMTQACLP